MSDLGLPMCALCGHFVERMHKTFDILTDTYTFSVHCHGEVERIDIGEEAFANALQVKLGRAFEKPRALLNCKRAGAGAERYRP